VIDGGYAPKAWSNVAVTVSRSLDENLSTITFTGYEHGEFVVRSVLSTKKHFNKKLEAMDVIGHRVGYNGEVYNTFFGFIYYIGMYNYDNEDFSLSVGRCHSCD
jgi:hypothetical protein